MSVHTKGHIYSEAHREPLTTGSDTFYPIGILSYPSMTSRQRSRDFRVGLPTSKEFPEIHRIARMVWAVRADLGGILVEDMTSY